MALTGFDDNIKYLRSDKPQHIQGANYGNGRLVINGRYDYQPLDGLNWADESKQVCNTAFVSNYARKKFDGKNSISLIENRFYSLVIDSDTMITLPNPKNKNVNNEIMVFITYRGGSINYGTDLFFDGDIPKLNVGNYNLYYDFDPLQGKWVAGILGGGGLMYNKAVFTDSSSYTFSKNIMKAVVHVVGSGGTSGNLYKHRLSFHRGVNGGGAGGYSVKQYGAELSGKNIAFVVGAPIKVSSTDGEDSVFLDQRGCGGKAGVRSYPDSGKGGLAIGGSENYNGKSGTPSSGTWSAGEGLGADGWELFGNKYGYGGGCGDCQTCSDYKTGYNTVSGGGCVIIEEWAKI